MTEWIRAEKLIPYLESVKFMEDRVAQILDGTADEAIWLLEHPPLFTAGSSADISEYDNESGLPLFKTGRGGKLTYHGPGQRVIYVMMDLRKRKDVRRFVIQLENWIILSLNKFNIHGETRTNRVGIWVVTRNNVNDQTLTVEKKVSAIGIRLRKWIAFHGISINVNPNMQHYKAIVPCGLHNYGVTSLHELGCKISMSELDNVLYETIGYIFPDKIMRPH